MDETNQVELTENQMKQSVFNYVQLRLGDKMVRVELPPESYENSLTRAVEVFRTRSNAAVEESFSFLKIEKDVQIYVLPQEIQFVRQIWRRNIGDLGNAGSAVDPFSQGYLNVYILNSGRNGGLLNYELFKNYEFLTSRFFGGFINFTFNSVTKKLTLHQKPYGDIETVMLWTYNLKPLVQLLTDYRTLTFLKEYTYALCLSELGQAREKYASIPGPSGGTTLNGAALKAESAELIQKLHEDIQNYHFGEEPLGMIIG
ncbi:Uncharacterised protein [uncultured archaeon]|nr:Uncharacterised protein [uncultured archaeon]